VEVEVEEWNLVEINKQEVEVQVDT